MCSFRLFNGAVLPDEFMGLHRAAVNIPIRFAPEGAAKRPRPVSGGTVGSGDVSGEKIGDTEQPAGRCII